MREPASKVGGSSAVQPSGGEAPVGKQSLVEQTGSHSGVVQRAAADKGSGSGGGPRATEARKHKSGGEKLADAGEKVLDGVKEALQKLADELTKYNEAGAEHAKEQLEHIRATCGPGTAHIDHKVQVQADKLTNFYFARLMRAAAGKARDMADACAELSKQLHEHKAGAIGTFIAKALLAAGELLIDFGEFSTDVGEVNTLVAEIGSKCERRVQLKIPHALRQHVLPKPKFKIHINPHLLPDGPVITLPGLKLPGGHTVLPHGLSVPKGPVLGQYVA